MLLSAVSVFVVAQWSSEIPKGLMNNPVEKKKQSKLYGFDDIVRLTRQWEKSSI